MDQDAAAKARMGTVELLTGKTPPEHGPDRFLIIAIDLFYKHGFGPVTIDQIVAEAGSTREEFFKHFPSKDELVVQAIRQHDEWEREAWQRAVREIAGDDPAAQLLAMFDVMDKVFTNPAYRGCLFIKAAGEFPDENHPVHRAAMEHKHAALQWFHAKAEEAGMPDPDRFAYEYTAIFEGALILEQVHHDPSAVRITRPMAERLIRDHLAGRLQTQGEEQNPRSKPE